MTELTEHAKAILRGIADGKQIECASKQVNKPYASCSHDEALYLISQGQAKYLRIKPETRSINGREFAAPDGGCSGYYITLIVGGIKLPNKEYSFADEQDRDTAYQAIVDALGGRRNE